MVDRVKGKGGRGRDARSASCPRESAIDWDALPLTAADRQLLLAVSRGEWAAEVPEIHAFFERFGERLPPELAQALGTLEQDLARVSA